MAIVRVSVDVPVPDDTSVTEIDHIASRIVHHADAVIGPKYLAEKAGESVGTWHVHHSSRNHRCERCSQLSNDKIN